MLNREKLARDILSMATKLFPDSNKEYDLSRQKWDEITKDASFAHRVGASQSSFLIPRWEGRLDDVFDVEPCNDSHSVIAVDGSQIYPDRHVSGAGCFLINVGGVILKYGSATNKSSACFFSEPHVLLPFDIVQNMEVMFSRDLVDFKREEYELAMVAQQALQNPDSVCLIDGSIVFWPLESKPPEIKKCFLDKYLCYLDVLYKNRVLVAGYISMPKSRELVGLIKLGLCRYAIADCIRCHSEHETFPCKQVEPAQGAALIDTNIVRFFLEKYQRTTVFYSTSKITESYPDHLRPAFVYCDVGSEIVRIEVPSWIAQDKKSLNRICSIAINQSQKGQGYPIALAEAHEQAVVKGGDREFFYHLLYKVGIDNNKKFKLSQKAIKKRQVNI